MLEKFIPIFNANIEIYLQKLDEKVGKGVFNMESYVTYLSLDIISGIQSTLILASKSRLTLFISKIIYILNINFTESCFRDFDVC